MHPAVLMSTILRALPFAMFALATGGSSSAMSPASPLSLAGHVWSWQEMRTSTGERVVVTTPDSYTIEFMSDGVLRVRADCNRGSGRYSGGPGPTLAIGPIAATKMGCPDGSQDRLFLKFLHSVERYRLEGPHLVLDTPATGASMRFVALVQ